MLGRLNLRKRNVSQDRPEWSAKIGLMKPRGGPAGVVVKDGFIVAEWGGRRTRRFNLQRYEKLFICVSGCSFLTMA
ncbi:MAG: hypothetical protein Ct9H300mP19_00670 [Dehalococcoidia bacterium]|nr:MAG: hypothetical protein Ct9H300mP19_00670 [Dehalococcoidia bacterium]